MPRQIEELNSNTVVSNALEWSDFRDETIGRYFDAYKLNNITPGRAVTISMSSQNFDTWVGVYNIDSGEWVAWDDNSGIGSNSQLSFTPTYGDQDSYVIFATSASPNSAGNYYISASQNSRR